MTNAQELHQIEMQKRIEAYIKGLLNQDEIDRLWILFLVNPYWYKYLQTLVTLHSLIKKRHYK